MPASFNPEQQYQLAVQAYQQGDLLKALEYMKELIEHVPDNDALLADYGGMLMANGSHLEAESVLNKALSINPHHEHVLINLAMVHKAKGEHSRAIEILNNALINSSQKPELHFNLGHIYLDLGQLNDAKTSFKTALEGNPNFLGAYFQLGIIANHQGESKGAINHFAEILKHQPAFEPALLEMGNAHADLSQIEEAIKYYKKALEVNPNSFLAYNLLGKLYTERGSYQEAQQVLQQSLQINDQQSDTYLILGHVAISLQENDKARAYYEKALVINPNNEAAQNSLNELKLDHIPAWHFDMLADQVRNNAYNQAIQKAVKKEDVVLDIGTGSGLLSMMTARAGAHKVIACEMNPMLAKVAAEIVNLNGFEENIKVYSKKSNELKVDTELPKKATVLVSEILDVLVIGEGVLPSLRHATANLLTDNARIIPSRACVFAQLLEAPAMSRISPLHKINGFDLSPFNQFKSNKKHQIVQLQTLEHQMLSDVFPVIDYDFYNLPPSIQESQPHEKHFDIKIKTAGELQAAILWFDLHLDDDIMVSSRPGGELVHWGQALFCFEQPKAVKAGETVRLKLEYSDLLMQLKLHK